MMILILRNKLNHLVETFILNDLNSRRKDHSILILDDSEYKHQDIVHYLKHQDHLMNRKCLILMDCKRKQVIHSFLNLKMGGIVSYEAAYIELALAIEHILNNKIYFSEEIKSRLLEEILDEKNISFLTSRELEIISLIGRGLSAQEIANKLKCSPMTINVHRSNIKKSWD